MYLVEFYDKLNAIHDAQPVQAGSPEAAFAAFYDEFMVAKGWGHNVVPVAAHFQGCPDVACPRCGNVVPFAELEDRAGVCCSRCEH